MKKQLLIALIVIIILIALCVSSPDILVEKADYYNQLVTEKLFGKPAAKDDEEEEYTDEGEGDENAKGIAFGEKALLLTGDFLIVGAESGAHNALLRSGIYGGRA